MNDAKSMLMMYSYAAMKANKPVEDKAEEKATNKVKAEAKAETEAKAAKEVKTKRRGKKNDEGTERSDSTVTKK